MTFEASLELVERRLRLLLTHNIALMSWIFFHKITNTQYRSFSCDRLMECGGGGGGGHHIRQKKGGNGITSRGSILPWITINMMHHLKVNIKANKFRIFKFIHFDKKLMKKGNYYLLLLKASTTLQRQNTEISKQIFPEKEYQVFSPNFHIHVSVSDLYISTIGLPTLLEEICRSILGLYKSLTDT